MGCQRPHTEFVGEGERLAVVGLGLVCFGRLGAGRDLAEEPPGASLIAAGGVLVFTQ